MTIQVPYRGIIEIVGDHDVGKTIAALQTNNDMRKVVFVDDDVKGDGTVRQMKDAGMDFDLYIDLAKERLELGQTPTADQLLQEVVIPTVNKIIAKKHQVIVWDTWRIVYQSARGHVERNKSKYQSVVDFTRGTSPMIQGLVSKVARLIEQRFLNQLKDACDLLVITHHIKDNYVSNVVVGKIPESSATFSEVCNMRLWLRRNPQSKVPVILFLKRPNVPKIVRGRLQFTNIVPLKITPTDAHESIWDAIAEYEEKPIQSRQPREDETPTPEEFAAISGTLTNEQKEYIKQMIEYNKMIEKELSETDDEIDMGKVASTIKKNEGEKFVVSDTPSNIGQFIAMANSRYGYDLPKIQDILKLSFAQINSRQDELPEFWKALHEEASSVHREAEPKKGKKK